MDILNQILLFLHFVGLTLGFSVSFANMVMGGLIAKAAPQEKGVLGRFPPLMSRLGTIGLVLLWVTGLTLVFTKWNGFAILPWQFHVKLSAVVLLTITVAVIHRVERLVQKGDTAAAAKLESLGKVAMLLAMTALLFAVLTFD